MQKEEGPRGMAKEDRLCSMLTVIYHQLSCFSEVIYVILNNG